MLHAASACDHRPSLQASCQQEVFTKKAPAGNSLCPFFGWLSNPFFGWLTHLQLWDQKVIFESTWDTYPASRAALISPVHNLASSPRNTCGSRCREIMTHTEVQGTELAHVAAVIPSLQCFCTGKNLKQNSQVCEFQFQFRAKRKKNM